MITLDDLQASFSLCLTTPTPNLQYRDSVNLLCRSVVRATTGYCMWSTWNTWKFFTYAVYYYYFGGSHGSSLSGFTVSRGSDFSFHLMQQPSIWATDHVTCRDPILLPGWGLATDVVRISGQNQNQSHMFKMTFWMSLLVVPVACGSSIVWVSHFCWCLSRLCSWRYGSYRTIDR